MWTHLGKEDYAKVTSGSVRCWGQVTNDLLEHHGTEFAFRLPCCRDSVKVIGGMAG